MENKRVIIAVVLSLGVLLMWNYLFPPAPRQVEEVVEPTQTADQPSPGIKADASSADSHSLGEVAADSSVDTTAVMPQGYNVTVDTPLYTAVLDSDGAVLRSFELKKYKESIEPDSPYVDLVGPKSSFALPMGLKLGAEVTWDEYQGGDLNVAAGQNATMRLTGNVAGVDIQRTLTFSGDGYLIHDDVQVDNRTEKQLKITMGFGLATATLQDEDSRYNLTRVAALTRDGGYSDIKNAEDLAEEGFTASGGLMWGGIHSNYFLLALIPPAPAAGQEGALMTGAVREGDVYTVTLERTLGGVKPGARGSLGCTYYLGPKVQKLLEKAPNDLAGAVQLGWFDFIAKPLLLALHFFQGYVGNWGVAIILLTIGIKIIFWPLSQKSYSSMNQLKKLQPMMAKIREKHKGNKQKMNEEMMSLYKTYKVNPAGGCLPMMLQIPVFIGLYQALLNSLELRHASFISHVPFTDIIWLADLSAKDPFYVTPVIMGATMFLQQKMTPSPGDPTQAKVMMFMPIFFTFIFLNFPAGLVIYWLTNNVLSIAQQWWMLRKSS